MKVTPEQPIRSAGTSAQDTLAQGIHDPGQRGTVVDPLPSGKTGAAAEDVESVDNVDVFVNLKDGSRWSATVITIAQVEILMKRWAASGEALEGRYFWCSDGLIVRDAGIGNMTQVLTGLIENGEFTRILQRLDD
ncbi:hypothetical protein [Streptomyces sp. CBMA152]|uniref:hypothetical protein n=1 Tax=Streptomyces sp. CBMA152 TaxID=1896312 RepID=UPI002948B7F7|nr:hypothetical protein [Streptomyces sp. CBMA152]